LTFLGFDFQHRGAGQAPDLALIIIVNIVQVHFVPAGKTVDFHILPFLIPFLFLSPNKRLPVMNRKTLGQQTRENRHGYSDRAFCSMLP
jgi:hypothetical protein